MKKILLFLFFMFTLISCKKDSTSYESQLNQLSEKYLFEREQALNKFFQTKIIETANSKALGFEQLTKISTIDRNFQNALDKINNKFDKKENKKFNNQNIFTGLSFETNMFLSVKYLYIKVLNFGLNFCVRIMIALALVLILSIFSSYAVKKDLFSIIFSHRIIIGLVMITGIFFNPAVYFKFVKNTEQLQVEVLTQTNISITKEKLEEIHKSYTKQELD